MVDNGVKNNDADPKPVLEDLLPLIELGCMEAFNKSFKELASMSEAAGKKLSVEEVLALAALGAKVAARNAAK